VCAFTKSSRASAEYLTDRPIRIKAGPRQYRRHLASVEGLVFRSSDNPLLGLSYKL